MCSLKCVWCFKLITKCSQNVMPALNYTIVPCRKQISFSWGEWAGQDEWEASHRYYPWFVSHCTIALEERINMPTLLIIVSATFKSCLNNRFLFQLCVCPDLWLKFIHSVKERCFDWMGLLPLCVWPWDFSFVLPQFYWFVLFSQIWVASGPLLEWRDLGKHWLFVPDLAVLLFWLPCAGLHLCPPSCSSPEQPWESSTAALWAPTATSSVRCDEAWTGCLDYSVN